MMISSKDISVWKGKKMADQDVEFVLIGAGLPRTGTMSTYTALEILLPGKCHHMIQVISDRTSRNKDHWVRASEGGVTDEEWREFVRLEGLSAGVDYPTSLFWKELMRIYPNAKVLLTDRDPVRWYQSVQNTILQVCELTSGWTNLPLRPLIGGAATSNIICRLPPRGPLGAKWPRGMFGAVEDGEESAVQYFSDWREEVLNEVPADRLLVWQVKEGWGPLCKFLEVPEPDQPFPNVNDTASMQAKLRIAKRLKIVSWTVITGGLAAAVYYFQHSVHGMTAA